MHFTGILVEGLQYIWLYLPRVAVATDTFLCRQHLYNLTYYVHSLFSFDCSNTRKYLTLDSLEQSTTTG